MESRNSTHWEVYYVGGYRRHTPRQTNYAHTNTTTNVFSWVLKCFFFRFALFAQFTHGRGPNKGQRSTLKKSLSSPKGGGGLFCSPPWTPSSSTTPMHSFTHSLARTFFLLLGYISMAVLCAACTLSPIVPPYAFLPSPATSSYHVECRMPARLRAAGQALLLFLDQGGGGARLVGLGQLVLVHGELDGIGLGAGAQVVHACL